jgi:hypothetical protein
MVRLTGFMKKNWTSAMAGAGAYGRSIAYWQLDRRRPRLLPHQQHDSLYPRSSRFNTRSRSDEFAGRVGVVSAAAESRAGCRFPAIRATTTSRA